MTLAATDGFAALAEGAGLGFPAAAYADARAHGGAGGRRDHCCARPPRSSPDSAGGYADAVADGTDLLLLSATTCPRSPLHLAGATGVPSLGVYLPADRTDR
ncbi:hypothetical protein LT493_23575 [Streptomyces tricolor]|nr:hypothetical protein [Streptomyces tricolor]